MESSTAEVGRTYFDALIVELQSLLDMPLNKYFEHADRRGLAQHILEEYGNLTINEFLCGLEKYPGTLWEIQMFRPLTHIKRKPVNHLDLLYQIYSVAYDSAEGSA